MSVKKAYKEIIDYLNTNQNVKVADVLPKVIEMASAKSNRSTAGSTFIKDTEGNVVAINCYFYRRWMPLIGDKAVEFGKKANTTTGLNTMCKAGVSGWSKRERDYKKAQADMLDNVKTGKIKVTDIEAEQQKMEELRKAISETDLGFDNKENIVKYLEANKVKLSKED